VTVVLIGPPGSGKTRLGKRVARLLKVPFVDTDRRIVAAHGSIAGIFATHGEPHFREIEREVVAQALTEPAIVSLGGGAILDPQTQSELTHHRVALITVSADAVANRITGTKRPLLVGGVESWTALFESRREIYERLGDRTWDTSVRPLDAIATEIAAWAGHPTHEAHEGTS
jgi:shikimate kinase